MNEERVVKIEAKIAFQENIIKDLSDTVYNQQKQIDALHETLKHLINHNKDSSSIATRGHLKDEIPPHY